MTMKSNSYTEVSLKNARLLCTVDQNWTEGNSTGTAIHLCKTLNNIPDKCFMGSARPEIIIAGGYVRDYIFGLSPKDYDVFVNAKDFDGDPEDLAVLIADSIPTTWRNPEPIKRLGGEECQYIGKEAELKGTVCVYEVGKYQIIVHTNDDIVSCFDYSLVKGYLNPETQSFFLHKEMLADLKNKTTRMNRNHKTENRVSSFENKYLRTKGNPLGFTKVHNKTAKGEAFDPIQENTPFSGSLKKVGGSFTKEDVLNLNMDYEAAQQQNAEAFRVAIADAEGVLRQQNPMAGRGVMAMREWRQDVLEDQRINDEIAWVPRNEGDIDE